MNNLIFLYYFLLGVKMDRKYLLVVLVVLIFMPKSSNENGYNYEVIVDNLDIPWAMDFLPN